MKINEFFLAAISTVAVAGMTACTFTDKQKISAAKPSREQPTHCRTTYLYVAPGKSEKLVFGVIKPNDVFDFITGTNDNYTFVYEYCTPDIYIKNRVCLRKYDGVKITRKDEKTVNLQHYTLVGRERVELTHGELQIDSSNPNWATGSASSKTGETLGEYRLFVRPARAECEHPDVVAAGTPAPECKSIVVEYFASDDTFANQHKPDANNVVAAKVHNGVAQCMEAGGDRETGDGEGDYGPDRR